MINQGLVKDKYLVTILGYFSCFSIKIYVVGTHLNHLTKAFLMSTYNTCFYGEVDKIKPG